MNVVCVCTHKFRAKFHFGHASILCANGNAGRTNERRNERTNTVQRHTFTHTHPFSRIAITQLYNAYDNATAARAAAVGRGAIVVFTRTRTSYR